MNKIDFHFHAIRALNKVILQRAYIQFILREFICKNNWLPQVNFKLFHALKVDKFLILFFFCLFHTTKSKPCIYFVNNEFLSQ